MLSTTEFTGGGTSDTVAEPVGLVRTETDRGAEAIAFWRVERWRIATPELSAVDHDETRRFPPIAGSHTHCDDRVAGNKSTDECL